MKIELYKYDEASEESRNLYEEIKSWSPEMFPPPVLLPHFGVIVRDDEGRLLGYVCADMSNTIPRAYLDFLMTNPAASKMARYKAMKLAVGFICKELKSMGYAFIMGMTEHAGIAIMAEREGFWMNPKALLYFCKNLNE